MVKYFIITFISLFFMISCGKPTPTDPDEKVIVDILAEMKADEDFFKFVAVGQDLFEKGSDEYKDFKQKMSNFSSSADRLSKALKTDPKQMLKIMGEKYIDGFEELDKRIDQAYKDKQERIDKIVASKANIRKIALACENMLSGKSDAKVPSLDEIKKYMGNEAVMTCPSANKPYEIVGVGEQFTGAADKALAQVQLERGFKIIVYQDAHVVMRR